MKKIRKAYAEGEEAVVALFGGVIEQVEELTAQFFGPEEIFQ